MNTKKGKGVVRSCLLGVAAMTFALTAQATLVVDRGLPSDNLNNAAGSDRSNVAWGFEGGNHLAGDDFTLGALDAGMKKWQIDQISLWTVGGEDSLGDRFSEIALFLGSGPEIAAVSRANLLGNSTDNTDVLVNQVTYPGSAEGYQGSDGGALNIWQLDFFNLGEFEPGQLLFALGGVGNAVTFSHASNSDLSGTPQDGSDGLYRWFAGNAADSSITFGNFLDSDGFGWDKSSDINIQVRASQVPEPSLIALLALGLLGMVLVSRRRNHLRA